MPHIILETTSDIVENPDVVDILERLVAKLATFETVSPKAIKGYHGLRNTWIMGEGAPAGFVHCEVAILTGRTPELKKSMADGMFAELQSCFEITKASGEASITLEVREMEADTYRK